MKLIGLKLFPKIIILGNNFYDIIDTKNFFYSKFGNFLSYNFLLLLLLLLLKKKKKEEVGQQAENRPAHCP